MAQFEEPFVNDTPEPTQVSPSEMKLSDIILAAAAIGAMLAALGLANTV